MKTVRRRKCGLMARSVLLSQLPIEVTRLYSDGTQIVFDNGNIADRYRDFVLNEGVVPFGVIGTTTSDSSEAKQVHVSGYSLGSMRTSDGYLTLLYAVPFKTEVQVLMCVLSEQEGNYLNFYWVGEDGLVNVPMTPTNIWLPGDLRE